MLIKISGANPYINRQDEIYLITFLAINFIYNI